MTDPYIHPDANQPEDYSLIAEANKLHEAIGVLSRRLDTRIIALSTLLGVIVLCCFGLVALALYNRSVNACQERHNNAVHDAWVRQIDAQTQLFSVVSDPRTTETDRYNATLTYQKYLKANPVPPADC